MTLDKGLEPNDSDMDKAYDSSEREVEYLEKIKLKYLPEDIFDASQLSYWAWKNGFILPDNNNTTKDY